MLFMRSEYRLMSARSSWPDRVYELFAILTLSGCATQASSPDDHSTKAENVSSHTQEVSVSASRAPATEIALIRRVADAYEIEVQSPAGFPPSGAAPVLRVGDSAFHRYRKSDTVGWYGLIYTLSAEEFAQISDAPIRVQYGRSSRRATSHGKLNKSTLSVSK